MTFARVAPWFSLVALATALGCDRPATRTSPAATNVTIDQAVRGADGVLLPRSITAREVTEPAVSLVVSRNEIRVAGDPYRVAEVPSDSARGLAEMDKRDGRRDFWVTPIEHAIRGARMASVLSPTLASDAGRGPSLAIVADEHTTYRVLFEIMFTAARAEARDSFVAARAKGDDHLVALPAIIASPSHESFSLILGAEAFTVRYGDVELGAGCDEDHDAPAVTRAPSDEEAWAALDACVKKLRAASPSFAEEKTATLGADGAIELSVVVRAMDMLRASFPDGVTFLAPRASPEEPHGGGTK